MSHLINTILVLGCVFTLQTSKLSEANAYFDNKQYSKSIEICTHEIDRLSPKDSLYGKFLQLRASAYAELEDYQSAANDCEILLKMNPRNKLKYLDLSYMYGQSGNFDKCEEILHKGLKIIPHDPNLLNNLSYYIALSGKYADAVNYANEGLKYAKDKQTKAFLLNNRGYGLINLDKDSEGLVDINNSINLHPDNPFAFCYRAIANIHLKHWNTVCDDLNKAKGLGAERLTADLIIKYCSN
ncbi:hypothetical protein IDJ77_23685 [Mucilaginibacter sp. ZT4R22]|uniref:Tetratricopeptide repeat protein n=1 Tax=Mucilaginibacter pankratovii TaxID=2772110 RepID=A0ABR7WYY7_9SPHI|nr:hypothetical protein [Mucilaginibacter pankratovii]MBD1366832.1 hypothetical protein [Mucilaginibacter pankratovii]